MTDRRQIRVYREEMAISLMGGVVPSQRRMLLFPFEEGSLSLISVDSAVQMAEESAAELVFLCVRLPATGKRIVQEGEHLFSSLKSLQAQLQDRGVPVKIETVVGPVAQFVRDYSQRHQADMILIPGRPAGGGRRIQA
jgi:nucleotide-binding universal stress UspA family protein